MADQNGQWSNTQLWNGGPSEHAVSKPIAMHGHLKQEEVLSPRSTESTSLYVNIVDNVLGSSPNSQPRRQVDLPPPSALANGIDKTPSKEDDHTQVVAAADGSTVPQGIPNPDLSQMTAPIAAPTGPMGYGGPYPNGVGTPVEHNQFAQFMSANIYSGFSNTPPHAGFSPASFGMMDQFGQLVRFDGQGSVPMMSNPGAPNNYYVLGQPTAGQPQVSGANVGQIPTSTNGGRPASPTQGGASQGVPNGTTTNGSMQSAAALAQQMATAHNPYQAYQQSPANMLRMPGAQGMMASGIPPGTMTIGSPPNSIYGTSPISQPFYAGMGNVYTQNPFTNLSQTLGQLSLSSTPTGSNAGTVAAGWYNPQAMGANGQAPMNVGQRRDSYNQQNTGQQGMPIMKQGAGNTAYNAYQNSNLFSQTPPPSVTTPAGYPQMGYSNNAGQAAAAAAYYNQGPGAQYFSMGPTNAGVPRAYTPGTQGLQQAMQRTTQSPYMDRPGTRSRILEEFRNSRLPQLALRDIQGHIVEFSQDQHGSRFIQQKLERAHEQERQLVFAEILAACTPLMTDVFGNYVIQKFFEFGTDAQRQQLVAKLKSQVLVMALQMYGCRVIQKALETCDSDTQQELLAELDGQIVKCVKDQNGNHVIQKVIECVDSKHLSFVVDSFKDQVFVLSTHPYGCRVIQRILEHCAEEQKRGLLEEMHRNTRQLAIDQYGNYVIQHVVEHGSNEDKQRIVTEVKGEVLRFAQHKFASNVIEKCLQCGTTEQKAELIEEVFAKIPNSAVPAPSVPLDTSAGSMEFNGGMIGNNSDSDDGTASPSRGAGTLSPVSTNGTNGNGGTTEVLLVMMRDQYANYVVQKMLDLAEPQQRNRLMRSIRPYVNQLRKFTYGKHIISKLERYFNKQGGGAGMGGGPPVNGAGMGNGGGMMGPGNPHAFNNMHMAPGNGMPPGGMHQGDFHGGGPPANDSYMGAY